MKCKKCGCEQIVLRRDKRGLPEALCAECGTLIKKMSTSEVIDYYEGVIDRIYPGDDNSIDSAEKTSPQGDLAPSTPLCKYCTEDIYIRQGRLGTIYRKLDDAKFCPMCGRPHQPGDRDY